VATEGVSGDVWIDREREEVFEWLVQPEHQTVWQSELEEFEPHYEGLPEEGETARGVVKVAGVRFEWIAEITAYEWADCFAFESVDSPFPFSVHWWLEDDEGGTRLHYEGSAQVGGFLGRMSRPIVNRVYGSGLRHNFEHLKEVLEDDA
jgi:hypothetical protein